MRYYTRRDRKANVKGPFTIQELIEALKSGTLELDTFASSDLGDGQQRLHCFRRCDWFTISEIPEVRQQLSAIGEKSLETGQTRKIPMPLGMTLVASLFILAAMGYAIATLLLGAGILLQVEVSLPMRFVGVLSFVLWIGAAFCIITRRTWGWYFCLVVIAVSILVNLLTILMHDSSQLASWRDWLPGTVGSLGIGVYLFGRRDYFSPPHRS